MNTRLATPNPVIIVNTMKAIPDPERSEWDIEFRA
jgi:hypothetical protein